MIHLGSDSLKEGVRKELMILKNNHLWIFYNIA